MSLKILSLVLDSVKLKPTTGIPISVTGSQHQQRSKRHCSTPRFRMPYWYIKKNEEVNDEMLTTENAEFVKEFLKSTYDYEKKVVKDPGVLKQEVLKSGNWFPECMRTGVIAKKLGYFPQWLKNGKMVYTTLLQVVDNHVIKYIPPGQGTELRHYARKSRQFSQGKGQLVVGAVSKDPRLFTNEYCELFVKAGVMPKEVLTKFYISPEAVIQPGTPLYAGHFKVGDCVDVSGLTRDRGFQGVMKRWGFHGQPRSHGQTKTHRRPGNIGGGGEKGRVWPGKKLPGHMGNKTRTLRGLKILRINHVENILYVVGTGIAGAIDSFVFVHDTFIKDKRSTSCSVFPTYYPSEGEDLPVEEFDDSLFKFSDPSIVFEVEKVRKKK